MRDKANPLLMALTVLIFMLFVAIPIIGIMIVFVFPDPKNISLMLNLVQMAGMIGVFLLGLLMFLPNKHELHLLKVGCIFLVIAGVLAVIVRMFII